MLLEYNKNNRDKVIDIIKDSLTIDLIPKKWQKRNINNPMFGHCHNAAATFKKIFGKQVELRRALDDEGIWHWWCVDNDGNIIDITADQYYSEGKQPPWEKTKGEKASPLGFDYRKRVESVTERVKRLLGLSKSIVL